jgi:5-methylcytosine-specific restriction endonuclease McrA
MTVLVDHQIDGSELIHKRTTKTRFRKGIFEAWGGECCYCGKPADTLDHVNPKLKGGLTVRENLVPACAPCNRAKGHLEVFGWWRNSGHWDPMQQQRLINWLLKDGKQH